MELEFGDQGFEEIMEAKIPITNSR